MRAGSTSIAAMSINFDELDAGGVVYHANYITICDRARNLALADLGLHVSELMRDDLAFAVVKSDNTFRRPLRMDHVHVATRLISWSNRSLVVKQAIFDQVVAPERIRDAGMNLDELDGAYFTSETKLVLVKVSAMKATPIPKNLRELLGLHAPGVEA